MRTSLTNLNIKALLIQSFFSLLNNANKILSDIFLRKVNLILKKVHFYNVLQRKLTVNPVG